MRGGGAELVPKFRHCVCGGFRLGVVIQNIYLYLSVISFNWRAKSSKGCSAEILYLLHVGGPNSTTLGEVLCDGDLGVRTCDSICAQLM